VANHIYSQALPNESVGDTVNRLLKLVLNGKPKKVTTITTIKIFRIAMKKIVKEAMAKESRGQTLGRLFGVTDDGNVREISK
jgi:hypothetical protein